MKLAIYNLLHDHHHLCHNFLSTHHHLPLCEIEWRSTSTTPLTPDSNQEPAQPEGREHASETKKIQSVFHLNAYWEIAFSRGTNYRNWFDDHLGLAGKLKWGWNEKSSCSLTPLHFPKESSTKSWGEELKLAAQSSHSLFRTIATLVLVLVLIVVHIFPILFDIQITWPS